MKIIHVIFSFYVGGAETMLVDILNRQCQEASVGLIIVNSKVNRNLLDTIDKRVNIYLLNRKESNKIQLLSAFFKINQILNKINPDVIHCHINRLFPFFIKWRKKTCLTVHNVNLSTLFLKNYRTVFAISRTVQEDIAKRTGIFAPIVYNGIEIEQYKRRITYNFNKEEEVFQIVLLSRLFPEQKGQHIAMQSIRILKKQDLNVKLYLIGGGDQTELNQLKKLAIEYGIENEVEFAGQVDREWIKNNLKNFHLLIQPSLYEGFGITVIEGFACGLPVIASNLDGPKEIMETLHSGLLIKPNDPVDLAEKINQVIYAYINEEMDTKYISGDNLHIFDIQTTVENYMRLYLNQS